MSSWIVLALILWFAAAMVWAVSMFLPVRLRPPRYHPNRRGFPLRLTLWMGAGVLVFFGVVFLASG